MEYQLKNGNAVIIRESQAKDAEAVIQILTISAGETRFLARNPGEFNVPVEKEREIIERILKDPDSAWFVAEYEGKVVGQCSVGLVQKIQRYRHRARLAFAILGEYCNLGIGGKMMEECIRWCKEKGVTQMELEVVKGNDRALAMYLGFGFEVTGVIPSALRYLDGTCADEYFMVKFL